MSIEMIVDVEKMTDQELQEKLNSLGEELTTLEEIMEDENHTDSDVDTEHGNLTDYYQDIENELERRGIH